MGEWLVEMDLPQAALERLCVRYDLDLLVLFGSFGTDRSDAESDVDLAIWARDARSIQERWADVAQELSGLFGMRPVDLVLLNRADPLLRFEVSRTGRPVYQKSPDLFACLQVRAMQGYNDAQKFHRLDIEYIRDFLRGGGTVGRSSPGPPQVE